MHFEALARRPACPPTDQKDGAGVSRESLISSLAIIMAMRSAVQRLFGLTRADNNAAVKLARAFAGDAAPSHGVVSQVHC